MTSFIRACVFAVIWVAITGSATILNLVFGFAVAALALWVVRGEIDRASRKMRIGRMLSLLVLFIRELAMSAWKVAVLVTRPRLDVKPGIFAFPLTVSRDFEITLLANLITLTPGTLSLDVSADRKFLFVHALDASDIDATKREIADGFERKILEAFE
jgi:multicomponent Na+:H+ antiporter subunit E